MVIDHVYLVDHSLVNFYQLLDYSLQWKFDGRYDIHSYLCFTVQDPTSASRQVAVRIKHLAKGTIAIEQYLPEKYFGTVEKEAGVTQGTNLVLISNCLSYF